jgi:hypothetical protein
MSIWRGCGGEILQAVALENGLYGSGGKEVCSVSCAKLELGFD